MSEKWRPPSLDTADMYRLPALHRHAEVFSEMVVSAHTQMMVKRVASARAKAFYLAEKRRMLHQLANAMERGCSSSLLERWSREQLVGGASGACTP